MNWKKTHTGRVHVTHFLTYLFTYSLTYSMEQSLSWEANLFSDSQEIPPHFIEPEGSLPHSQVPATCPYPEPARSSLYPTPYSLKIHLNIILPSKPESPKWSLILRFPHQNPVYASPLPHMRYMPRPSHSSPFYHPNNMCRYTILSQSRQ